MLLDHLEHRVVLAPLGGGPSTPELTGAVCDAGGLGSLAAGYLSVEALSGQIGEVRRQTDRPFVVNLFCPGSGPTDPRAYRPWVDELGRWAEREGLSLGEPRYSDDGWESKLELLLSDPVAGVSFTFGCPPREVVRRLQAVGSEVWVTVTAPEEAEQAVAAGAEVLVVQGAEAGGHRGSFSDRPDAPLYPLLPLLARVRNRVAVPLVATGGVVDGAGAARAFHAGAAAVQAGTAFLLAPEAGTSKAHREALAESRPTVLTRAFTGRLARGLQNRFATLHTEGAPVAYPELHYVTAPLRARAREQGDAELINLWAGEGHGSAAERPAGEIVASLSDAPQRGR